MLTLSWPDAALDHLARRLPPGWQRNTKLGISKLLENLNWRYATKKFDPTKTVSQDKVERHRRSRRLAPTSSGLQPFEVLVVTNADIKAKMLPIASGQAQVVEACNVLVFAAWDNYTADRINSIFDYVVGERKLEGERLTNWNA